MRAMAGWPLICCCVWNIWFTAAHQHERHSGAFSLCGRSDKQLSDFSDRGLSQRRSADDRHGQLLDLRVTARHSMYDSSEVSGQFVVTALLSDTRGQPLHEALTSDTASLDFSIQANSDDDGKMQLASGRIALGTRNRLLKFSLGRLTPRLKPYQINFIVHGQSEYSATTELYYLPAKREGSAAKIDTLHGGLLVANNSTAFAYEHFIPFALHADCSVLANLSHAEISAYKDAGVNTFSSICDTHQPGVDELYDDMESMNMWYQYSLESPHSKASMLRQVSTLKDRSNLLSWHIGVATDQTSDMEASYALLKQQDPYHPIGRTFSCDDSGDPRADYITVDPASSVQNLDVGKGSKQELSAIRSGGNFQDTVDRLEAYTDYITSLDESLKLFWAAPPASAAMTSAELWVTVMLTFNHNAKAILLDLSTMTKSLTHAYGLIASAFNKPEVSKHLLSCAPTRVDVEGINSLDVSYWKQGSQVLVAIANLNRIRTSDNVSIDLPFSTRRVASQPWGSLSWSLTNGTVLSTYGLDGLATSLLVFDT